MDHLVPINFWVVYFSYFFVAVVLLQISWFYNFYKLMKKNTNNLNIPKKEAKKIEKKLSSNSSDDSKNKKWWKVFLAGFISGIVFSSLILIFFYIILQPDVPDVPKDTLGVTEIKTPEIDWSKEINKDRYQNVEQWFQEMVYIVGEVEKNIQNKIEMPDKIYEYYEEIRFNLLWLKQVSPTEAIYEHNKQHLYRLEAYNHMGQKLSIVYYKFLNS